jgi:hypothetical protein
VARLRQGEVQQSEQQRDARRREHDAAVKGEAQAEQ